MIMTQEETAGVCNLLELVLLLAQRRRRRRASHAPQMHHVPTAWVQTSLAGTANGLELQHTLYIVLYIFGDLSLLQSACSITYPNGLDSDSQARLGSEATVISRIFLRDFKLPLSVKFTAISYLSERMTLVLASQSFLFVSLPMIMKAWHEIHRTISDLEIAWALFRFQPSFSRQ